MDHFPSGASTGWCRVSDVLLHLAAAYLGAAMLVGLHTPATRPPRALRAGLHHALGVNRTFGNVRLREMLRKRIGERLREPQHVLRIEIGDDEPEVAPCRQGHYGWTRVV